MADDDVLPPPLEIPWQLASTTQPLAAGEPDETAISLFVFEPEDEEISSMFPGQRLVYLKLTTSISPAAVPTGLPAVAGAALGEGVPCFHVLLDVKVRNGAGDLGTIHPYFHAAAPLARRTIQSGVVGLQVVEGELDEQHVGRSGSELYESSSTRATTTSVGASAGIGYGSVSVGGSVRRTSTDVAGERAVSQVVDTTMRDASQERRELTSHHTRVENILTLLNAKDVGTPHLRFSMSPRPLQLLSVDPSDPNLWFNQLLQRRSSGIEGIQEFTAVVLVPRGEDFCVNARLRRVCVLDDPPGPLVFDEPFVFSGPHLGRALAYLHRRFPVGTWLEELDVDLLGLLPTQENFPARGDFSHQDDWVRPVLRSWIVSAAGIALADFVSPTRTPGGVIDTFVDAIYRWDDGNSWTHVSGELKHVSVADDGTVWGVNADDEIYRWNGSGWDQVPGSLKQISVGNAGSVWGVNSDDEIYRWVGNSWTHVSGELKHVSVADDGTVWGVNADDEIYRWNGSGWDQVPGSLKQISVGNAGSVWGVNSDDEIYRWVGNSWTHVSGELKHVSVADDGTVWGVNADDEIYRWNGSGWDQVPGSLKQISVGNAGSVWGVNSDDEIYRRDGSWTQVSGAHGINYKHFLEIWKETVTDEYERHVARSPLERGILLSEDRVLDTCFEFAAGGGPAVSGSSATVTPMFMLDVDRNDFDLGGISTDASSVDKDLRQRGFETVSRWNLLDERLAVLLSNQASRSGKNFTLDDSRVVKMLIALWSKLRRDDPRNLAFDDAVETLKLTHEQRRALRDAGARDLRDIAQAIQSAPELASYHDRVRQLRRTPKGEAREAPVPEPIRAPIAPGPAESMLRSIGETLESARSEPGSKNRGR